MSTSGSAAAARRGPRPLRLRQDDVPVDDRWARPADGGQVSSTAQSVADLSQAELIEFRRHRIGFIFQAFGLLPVLSAAENVEVPLRLVAADPREREERVARAARAGRPRRPRRTTGRTSCRAASSSGSPSPARWPTARTCCSPTSRPASSTHTPAGRSWACSGPIVRSEGVTAIVATHDPTLIDLADRVIELRDGQVVDGAGTAG